MTQADPDLALLGASLAACIAGTLLMIEDCSVIAGYEKGFYLLPGLASACARLGPLPQQRPETYARARDETGEPR